MFIKELVYVSKNKSYINHYLTTQYLICIKIRYSDTLFKGFTNILVKCEGGCYILKMEKQKLNQSFKKVIFMISFVG